MKKRYFLAGLAIAAGLLAGHTQAQLNWVAGNGDWVDDSLWDDLSTPENDELFTNEAFGQTNGLRIGSGELSNIVNISDAEVSFDPNTYGDFQFRPGAEVDGVRPPGGVLNLTNATLSMNSDSTGAVDGFWTQFDGDELNLDNSTLRRTKSGDSNSGGALIFGSWRSYTDQVINVNLTNGSTIDNDGQLWFGAWGDNSSGLNVNMTINNGTLDLKGGFDEPTLAEANADLVFINGRVDDVNEPKNEKYAINFTGPGSIRVSDGGILHAIQEEDGTYGDSDFDIVSYETLWNRGILQAHGYSGATRGRFGGFFEVEGAPGDESYVLTSKVTEPVPIVWDGGDGAWNSANWNGGQTANDVTQRTSGLEIGRGEIGFDITIDDGLVTFDPNTFGDFRYRGGGTLTINEGAELTMNTDSESSIDGFWSQFDGDAMNLAGGTFSRTRSGVTKSGGAMIFGSWGSYDGQKIEVNITDGGSLENHGQLWFGAWGDNAPGLEVEVTINDGAIDLTGGDSFDLVTGEDGTVGPGNADLIFINGFEEEPKGESYTINFTGPGSITVDKSGILNPIADGNEDDPASYGDTLSTLLSYEDLWDRGILKANGQSGLDGANFADFFATTGASGQDDYMLMSLLGMSCDPNTGGDLDGNGVVDFADFLTLSGNFGTAVSSHTEGDIDCNGTVEFADFLALSGNFGSTAEAESVPEPSSALLLALASLVGLTARSRRN